jgi:hypothetical protein
LCFNQNGEDVEKLHTIIIEAGELGDWYGWVSHDSILRLDD